MQGKHIVMEDERLLELYSKSYNTLRVLMTDLRLEKEWETNFKQQYAGVLENSDLNASSKSIIIDPDDTVKLLTRCTKLYEARS